MKNEKNAQRQAYVKPEITRVNLIPEQAVLGTLYCFGTNCAVGGTPTVNQKPGVTSTFPGGI